MVKKVWVVVRDPQDLKITPMKDIGYFVLIRGIFTTEKAARKWVQTLWNRGEQPQCRVETYLLNPGKPL